MSRRRSVAGLMAIAGAAVLALSACGSPGSSGTSSSSSTPAPAEQSTEAAATGPTAGAGSAEAGTAAGPADSSATGPSTEAGSGAASSGNAASPGAGGEPINVGIVTSLSGPLQTYGDEYLAALKVGIDYATDGSGAVNGRPVVLKTVDDAADPTKATAAATDLIGQGYKILAGSVSSGVALQMAPLAA